jgi:rare lipoprotein A (peptidoglycan hydrolase)
MRPSGQIRTLLAMGAALALIAIPSAAQAEDGGIAAPGPSPEPQTDSSYQRVAFGSRDLRKGMSGEDVKTLNWLMAALAGETPLDGYFRDPTDQRVRDFQGSVGLTADGVVRKDTRKKIASRMRNNLATWYGPGFYGRRTACGKTLKKTTIGVAHRKLPCGTRVTFAYMGRWVRAKVIDRGPYNRDYKWDLTRKTAKRLGFVGSTSGRLKAAVVR